MSSGTGFFGSPIYKKVMSKVYGIGAAVAIIGALFKIMHFPGASIMLTAGLGVEALIFFLSAFEPPHEMPDWSLVYPELVGLESHEDTGLLGVASPSVDVYQIPQGTAQLDPGAIAKLGDGINSFAQSVDQLADMREISAATSSYLAALRSASGSIDSLTEVQTQTTNNIRLSSEALNESYVTAAKSVADGGMKISESLSKSGESMIEAVQLSGKQLTDVYSTVGQNISVQMEKISEVHAQTNQEINQSSEALCQSYATAAKSVADGGMKVSDALAKSGENVVEAVQLSGKQLTSVYNNIEQSMTKHIEQLSEGATMYNDNMQVANNKLSAINTVYELHLASINSQVNEVNQLAKTLGELNAIYGNMLNAVSSGK